jgi:hypothetical protein
MPPQITRRVTIVYYWMSAIKEDLELLFDAAERAAGTEWLWDINRCIAFHEQLLQLSESTIPLMAEAERRLERRDHTGFEVVPRRTRVFRDLKYRLFGYRWRPEDEYP